MAWKKNKRLIEEGFRDLAYVPRARCGWDCTLASLAYGARIAIDHRLPDLNAWAVRHGALPSGRYADLGADALVLWHGTSRPRAEKIAAHGLFTKGGLWTTTNPTISHGYCRWRSDPFETEGAVVCLVLDRRQVVAGRDYDLEGASDILRFQHALPPQVVEYVLTRDQTRFVGPRRAAQPSLWPAARLKRHDGRWVPLQKPPVRYSDSSSYSTPEEFCAHCLHRLLAEAGEVTALEVFATLYGCLHPWDALEHEDVLDLIDRTCEPAHPRGKWQTFRLRRRHQGDGDAR